MLSCLGLPACLPADCLLAGCCLHSLDIRSACLLEPWPCSHQRAGLVCCVTWTLPGKLRPDVCAALQEMNSLMQGIHQMPPAGDEPIDDSSASYDKKVPPVLAGASRSPLGGCLEAAGGWRTCAGSGSPSRLRCTGVACSAAGIVSCCCSSCCSFPSCQGRPGGEAKVGLHLEDNHCICNPGGGGGGCQLWRMVRPCRDCQDEAGSRPPPPPRCTLGPCAASYPAPPAYDLSASAAVGAGPGEDAAGRERGRKCQPGSRQGQQGPARRPGRRACSAGGRQ